VAKLRLTTHGFALVAWTMGLLLLVPGGCERQVVPVDLGRPKPPVVVPVPAPTKPVAEPTASASSPPAKAAPAHATDDGLPRRTGVSGSTRGTVACGESRCRVPAERCYLDQQAQKWTCARAGTLEGAVGAGLSCDDASDCREDMACCSLLMARVESACVPRSRLKAECYAEICVQGGPSCPPGRTCTASAPGEQGQCVAPKGPATCEGRKRCPADAPICIESGGKLQCVAMGSPAYMAVDVHKRWQCTQQDDCHAGDTCSYTYGESRRPDDLGTTCARLPDGIEGTRVCDPKGPSLCRRGGACGHQCVVSKGRPPWMGGWVPKR
jgi:hypothetical protein